MADPITRSGSSYSTPRDSNRVPLLIAASVADGITPVVLEADPVTHSLSVAATVSSSNAAVRLDDITTANVTYVGKAAIASDPANAVWQIFKMDETTGLVITWADGNDNFDNVWNNRASLSYS